MKTRNLKTLFKTGIERQRFYSRDASLSGMAGREAVIIIEEVEKPKIVFNGYNDITIADRGYIWYQLAPRDKFFWLSAAYNDKAELIELYFDITAGNSFVDPENPSFTDMYLDIVVTPSGDIRVLDRDELDAALSDKLITEAEYREAIEHCDELYRFLAEHRFEVIERCEKAMNELKGLI